MAEVGDRLRLDLVTRGDPHQLTGGHLYQQRMAAAAFTHKAELAFVSLDRRQFPPGLVDAQLRHIPPCDAVLVDSIVAASLAWWVRRHAHRIPLIAVVHQQPGGVEQAGVRRSIGQWFDLVTYRRAAAVIATSEFLKARLCEGGIESERIVVVPPGRDPAAVQQPAGADLRHGRQAAIICVSNWTPNKSIELALEAVAHLKPEMATLHLIGRTDIDPVYTTRLRRRLLRPDLRSRVVVHGPLPPAAVPGLLQAADIFVHPSRHEAYGAAVAESMAAGLPVVGFRIDNLPYLVRNGTDGILAPFGEVPALAAALALLIGDSGRRAAMGEAAKVRAMSWPTWVETANRFFSAIRQSVAAYGSAAV